jgi:hypothetical protein
VSGPGYDEVYISQIGETERPARRSRGAILGWKLRLSWPRKDLFPTQNGLLALDQVSGRPFRRCVWASEVMSSCRKCASCPRPRVLRTAIARFTSEPPPEVLQEHDIVERCEMSYSDMRAGAEELGDLMGHHHADVRSGAALYLGILPAQDRRHRSRPSAGARLRQEDPTEPVWDRQASAVTA